MILYLLVLFFCYPLLIFFYSIPRIRDKRYQFIILMFFLLSSYMMIPYENGDIRVYSNTLEKYQNYSLYDFISELGIRVFGFGEGGFEFFIELNVFLVSRFTNNIAWSFTLSALVVFLAWKSIVIILISEYDLFKSSKVNTSALLLLISFSIYIIFFRAVNGRFYIAYWVFIYSFYRIVSERKPKYYLLLFTTIFIHQSYIFLNLLVLLYRFTIPLQKNKRYETLLILLIVFGTVFSQLGLTVMSEYLSNLGGDFQSKYSDYVKESYVVGELERNRKWFQLFRTPLLFYSLALSLILARFNKKIIFDDSTTRIYYFVLIFWSINAFTINVPSFGDRFRNVLIGIFLVLLYKIYNTNKIKKIPLQLKITLIFFLFYKIVSLKILEFYLNKWLLYPFSLIFDSLAGRISIGD